MSNEKMERREFLKSLGAGVVGLLMGKRLISALEKFNQNAETKLLMGRFAPRILDNFGIIGTAGEHLKGGDIVIIDWSTRIITKETNPKWIGAHLNDQI